MTAIFTHNQCFPLTLGLQSAQRQDQIHSRFNRLILKSTEMGLPPEDVEPSSLFLLKKGNVVTACPAKSHQNISSWCITQSQPLNLASTRHPNLVALNRNRANRHIANRWSNRPLA